MKSFRAVAAGFLTVVILSVGTDFVLESLGIFPPIGQGLFITWMLVLAFAYRSVFTVVGGYVCAALAPDRPKRHIIILGCIGTVAGIAGVFAGWNMSDHWYPIALAVTGFPFTWIGGKLKTK
ncbi:MAG: hypothetical protein WCX28_08705 [Bacteriovoracaceae bacterium]|jgi:hypothetical protein